MNELDRSAVSPIKSCVTKADKPRGNDLDTALAITREAIAKRPAAHPELIVTSSETGAGLPELRAEIARLLTH
jgi:GTP-binding protein